MKSKNMVKKIIVILLIFTAMQLFGILFTSNNASGFFENVFEKGNKWKEMGEKDSNQVIENANAVFEATGDIFNTIRVIGAGMFVVAIAATGISLSLKGNGRDKAETKLTIAVIFLLAILFMCAEPLTNALQDLFETLEGTM